MARKIMNFRKDIRGLAAQYYECYRRADKVSRLLWVGEHDDPAVADYEVLLLVLSKSIASMNFKYEGQGYKFENSISGIERKAYDLPLYRNIKE